MAEQVTKIPGEDKWKYVIDLNTLLHKRDTKLLHFVPQCPGHGRQINVVLIIIAIINE